MSDTREAHLIWINTSKNFFFFLVNNHYWSSMKVFHVQCSFPSFNLCPLTVRVTANICKVTIENQALCRALTGIFKFILQKN